jgi:hypothetical protein
VAAIPHHRQPLHRRRARRADAIIRALALVGSVLLTLLVLQTVRIADVTGIVLTSLAVLAYGGWLALVMWGLRRGPQD